MSRASTPRTAPPTTPGAIGKVSPINGMAVSSLVCGLPGILIPVLNLVAIVLGAVAIVKIKRSNGRQQGFAYAIVGLSLGVVGFFVSLMLVFMVTGMIIAIQTTKQMVQAPNMAGIFQVYATYAKDTGRYPVHAAEIVTADSSVPLHHWVVDGFAITNNQVTVGNYDFINYDFSPQAAAAVAQAIDTADTTKPFYEFGDCWFVRLDSATNDPSIVLAWTLRGSSGERSVLFEDGKTRAVAPEEWDSVWEADAKAREVLELPAVGLPDSG